VLLLADVGPAVPMMGLVAGVSVTRRAPPYSIAAKAINRVGQTQVDALIFNPTGYHNNVIGPRTITVG
jgi:hypothetical protein